MTKFVKINRGKLIFPLPKVWTIDKKNFFKYVKKNY